MATNDDEYDGYYIPKGTMLFGNTWRVWTITGPYLCLDCICLGPYCMTPKFLTARWSTSLNGIWRMESSIQMWWAGTLWHLVTDAGEYIQHIHRYDTSRWESSQNLSWKILKRQLVILNRILSSRSLWHQTTSWRPGGCHRAQTRVH